MPPKTPRFRSSRFRNVKVESFTAGFRAVVGKPVRRAYAEQRRAMAVVVNWQTGKVAAWPIVYGEGCDVEAAEMKDELLKDVAERFGLGAEVDAWILMSAGAFEEAEKRGGN
jgi:hypothetical protein